MTERQKNKIVCPGAVQGTCVGSVIEGLENLMHIFIALTSNNPEKTFPF